VLLFSTALTAAVAGYIGYIAASTGWVWLIGSMAESVPREKHVTFLAALWSHNVSYLSGFVGAIILVIWVWRTRVGRHSKANQNKGMHGSGRTMRNPVEASLRPPRDARRSPITTRC
jgi:hypothetical protein